MSGNLDTNYLQSRGTDSRRDPSRPPSAAEVLRAWRKANKAELAEFTKTVAGSKLANIHIELMVAFIDKGEQRAAMTDDEPSHVLNSHAYTYDVMGEWIDRQASTVKELVKYLKRLGWIETTIDSKHYRGTTEIRVFARRACKSLKGVGSASIPDIKSRRRCTSQKRKADTRKRAKRRELRILPDGWSEFVRVAETWPGDAIEWVEAFRVLCEQGAPDEHIHSLLMEQTDEQPGPAEFVEAYQGWLARRLKRTERAKQDMRVVRANASLQELKSWNDD